MHKHSNFFTRMMNQGKLCLRSQLALNKLCSTLVQLVNTLTALKIIILYVQGCEKRKPKHIITDQSQNRTENLFFINLNRYLICRDAVEPRGQNSSSSQIDSQLSSQLLSFNDRHFSACFLDKLDDFNNLILKNSFLKY